MSGDLVSSPQPSSGGMLHCLGFRAVQAGGRLIGLVDLHVPRWRCKLLGCPVFRDERGQLSVALPTRPMIGHDRQVRLDGNGKQLFEPVVAFDDPATLRAFSDAAVAALLAYRPDLGGGR